MPERVALFTYLRSSSALYLNHGTRMQICISPSNEHILAWLRSLRIYDTALGNVAAKLVRSITGTKATAQKKKVVTALLVSSAADRLGPQAQTRRVRPKPFTLAPVVFWDSATCAAGFRADHCAIFPATTTQNKKQCAWKKGSTGQCWAILGNKRHLGHDRPWRKAWETVCFLEEIS